MSVPTSTGQSPYRTDRLTFPAVVMAALGLFSVLAAFNEWSNSAWLAQRTFGVFGSNLVFWGVVDVILGLIALYAAYSLWHGGTGGVVIASIWAIFAIVRWVWYISANPWLSITIIVLAVGVLWSITHEGDPAR